MGALLTWPVFIAIVLPAILYGFPALAGADGAYLVLSGSMEPTLAPGHVIFVHAVDPGDVRVGDVLTFRAQSGSATPITHRVIEVLSDGTAPRFRTQGDANEDPDPFVVKPDMVVGTHAFTIPYWGLLLGLLRSRAGFVAFVLVPGLVIVARELVVLYRELDAADRARRTDRARAREEADG